MSFALTIEDVFTISGRGTVLTGVVRGGPVRVGMEVVVTSQAGSARATVATIEAFRRSRPEAAPGAQVGLMLRGLPPTLRLARGDKILEAGADPGADTDTDRDTDRDTDTDPGRDVDPDREPQTDRPTHEEARKFLDQLGFKAPPGPALLLPLRIETARRGAVLQLRAYPDTIHVAPTDDTPSQAERELVAAYQSAVARGEDDRLLRERLDRMLGAARVARLLDLTLQGARFSAPEGLRPDRPVA
ncbi:hypothetical protein E4L95_22705, partial [Paracoccus liaowanqingii]